MRIGRLRRSEALSPVRVLWSAIGLTLPRAVAAVLIVIVRLTLIIILTIVIIHILPVVVSHSSNASVVIAA